ncbi:MAG: trigger factor [Syntrophobacteraceae bacterium]|nr:trigger factor [Desulfobacteraceae bacterium]
MNVSVVDLSASQKKIHVEIPAPKVQKEMETKYRDLSRQVRIKGFRPGKVPRNILKSYYGKAVEEELSSHLIEETYPEAIREADLKPLIEADVSEAKFEDNGTFTYSAVVDVCPPFEVEGYKGLSLHRTPVEIGDDAVGAELERIREQHAELRAIEGDRPAARGDSVLLDFLPYIEGVAYEKGATTDYLIEVGKNIIHPDFDSHLEGHAAGESFSFELDYPEDAPTAEVAGKKVRFDVTLKTIKEKILPELNDEFAKKAGQAETMEDFRGKIRQRLQESAEEKVTQEVRQQIVDQLIGMVPLDISPRVTEREVEHQIGLLQRQFQSQGLDVDISRFDTPEIRDEYRPQAEKNIRRRLILQQIAKQENVELTPEEMDEIYRHVSIFARVDIERVKSEYADSAVVVQAQETKTQDKVIQLIQDAAVYTETSEEEKSSDQE